MTHFAIDDNISSLDDVQGFDYDGYRFSEQHTEKELEPVLLDGYACVLFKVGF